MSRRGALQLAAGFGIAALGSTGCANPESDRPPGSRVTSHSSESSTPLSSRRELILLAALPDGAVVDVSTAAGEPAYLIRRGDSIRGLSATCTHARCRVTWQASSERFECPCHRGTYDSQGLVISGPPPRALEEIRLVIVNGTIYLEP